MTGVDEAREALVLPRGRDPVKSRAPIGGTSSLL